MQPVATKQQPMRSVLKHDHPFETNERIPQTNIQIHNSDRPHLGTVSAA